MSLRLCGLCRAQVGQGMARGYVPHLEPAGSQLWAEQLGCQPIVLGNRSCFSSRVTALSGACFAQWYLITFLLLLNIKQ